MFLFIEGYIFRWLHSVLKFTEIKMTTLQNRGIDVGVLSCVHWKHEGRLAKKLQVIKKKQARCLCRLVLAPLGAAVFRPAQEMT